jgi:hypothetical protein
LQRNRCRKGGREDVDEGVAEEQRADQALAVGNQLDRLARPPGARGGKAVHAGFRDGGERRLRSGKECRKHQQRENGEQRDRQIERHGS